LTLDPGTLVDVSIGDLPLYEAATFLNSLSKERIVVPADRMHEAVNINLKSKPLGQVVTQMGLTTHESIEREKRRSAWLVFLGGLAAGVFLLGFIYQRDAE
jgi:hypothetical protein